MFTSKIHEVGQKEAGNTRIKRQTGLPFQSITYCSTSAQTQNVCVSKRASLCGVIGIRCVSNIFFNLFKNVPAVACVGYTLGFLDLVFCGLGWRSDAVGRNAHR